MIGRLASPVEQAPRTSGTMVARVLGGFEVIAAGRHVARSDFQRAAAEQLVKLLLVTPGHAVSREAAAEVLWPDAEPEASRANLRKALHYAHRALAGTAALVGDGRTIGLDPAGLDLDLDRLRTALDHLAASPRGGGATANGPWSGPEPGASAPVTAPGRDDAVAAEIACILELGSRDLLPDDAYEDWLIAPREQLRSAWQRVALRAADRARELNGTAQAHAIVAQLLERDPTDEAAHRLAIELFAAEGRHHAARRQFDLCRRALREQLDAEPSEATAEVFQAAERSAARVGSEAQAAPRLVARRAELGRVEPLLERVSGGRLASLVIRGPAGIGKTRLLHEVVSGARAAGWQIIEWQAVESTRSMAYAPVTFGWGRVAQGPDVATWPEPARSAVATVVPDLGVPAGLAFAERAALVEGLLLAVRRVARERPLMLAIDDLPWLDDATLDLLQSSLAGLADVALLLATTWRDDEAAPDGVARFADGVRRSGGVELRLGPLEPRDVEALVAAHLGGETVAPDLARLLYEQSQGNPLFCLELVRSAADHGTARLDGSRWTSTERGLPGELPDSVRRLVAARSAALPPAARELLATAAELGSAIGYGALAAALPDIAGGLVEALDAALSSGLLAEQRGGYAFTHPMFRLALRGEMNPARRGAVHLRIARALAAIEDADSTAAGFAPALARCPDPITVADHALAAADLGVRQAMPLAAAFGIAAGIRARALFDRPAAVSLLERSLAIVQRLPPAVSRQLEVSTAHMNLAELRMAAGDDAAAEASFRDAISTARTPDELAAAYDRFMWLPYRHGDFEASLALMQEALARLPAEAGPARARMQESIGWCLGRLHRFDESVAMLEEAVAVLEASGDRGAAGYALDKLGTMLHMIGRDDEAIACLERALAIALEAGDVRAEQTRVHLGTALTRTGQPARARPHLARGLEIAHQMGDGYLEAVAAWMMAEMEDALGNSEGARSMRVRELALLAAMGGNPHNEALAHAHLANLARRAGDDAAAEREAAVARDLAARDLDPGYLARIVAAMAVERWSDLRTG